MAEKTDWKWDVFISYSHKDKDWVQKELIPRLKDSSLRVCFDYDFEISKKLAKVITEGILKSRRTILVLTPNYFESKWAEFEKDLAQSLDPSGAAQRIVPVKAEDCEIPPEINTIIYANFTKSDEHEQEWGKLITLLKKRTQIIGFIGLGSMGKPIAKRLLKEGFPIVFTSRKKQTRRCMEGLCTEYVTTHAEVARKSDIVILMLPEDKAVREVVFEENGILSGAKPGQIILVMSTISPATIKEVEQKARDKNVNVLNAPVNGDSKAAESGALTIIVGGDSKVFARARYLLDTIGSKTYLVGAIGMGQIVKLCHQLVAGGIMAFLGSVLALSRKLGVDLEEMHKVVGPYFDAVMFHDRLHQIFENKFSYDPALSVKIILKDMHLVENLAKEIGVELPIIETCLKLYEAAFDRGLGYYDFSAVCKAPESTRAPGN